MSEEYYKYGMSEKHDVPIGHLDYGYIEKCDDVKELEKILRVLRSGDEGRYPGLESVCESKIETLNPTSRLLRKDKPASIPSSMSKDEWKIINDDLMNWTDNIMKNLKESQYDAAATPSPDVDDASLPPIRKQQAKEWESDSPAAVVNGETKGRQSKKRVTPRNYNEWDKFDIDGELAKVDTTQKSDARSSSKSPSKSHPDLEPSIDSSGLSDKEKREKAEKEKEKGNEAFKCGDYEESALYYSRSVSLSPSAAAFNNRALCNLKLSRWTDAVNDSNIVISLEPENIKAYMRRGSGYQGLNLIDRAKSDFERVLRLEPENKRAQDLLSTIEKEHGSEINEDEPEVRQKGRRMVIEEVDGSDDEKDDDDNNDDTWCYGDKKMCVEDEYISDERTINEAHNDPIKTNINDDNLGSSKCHDDEKHHDYESVNEKLDDKFENKSNKNVDDIANTDVDMTSGETTEDIEDVMSMLGIGGSGVNTENHDSGAAPAERRDSDVKASCDNFVNDLLEMGMQKEKQSKFDDASVNNENDARQLLGQQDMENENDDNEDKDQETHMKVVNSDDDDVPSPESMDADEENGRSNDILSSKTAPDKEAPEGGGDGRRVKSELHISNKEKRPLFYNIALPPDVAALRETGNELFRKGQFPEATDCYLKAIKILDDKVKDYERSTPVDQQLKIKTEHPVSLSQIHNNCAACLLKTGDCAAAVRHCNKSLALIPHTLKPLIRRAMAYETLESTRLAYQDYRHVLEIDNSLDAAHRGADRCSQLLQQMDGSRWRERIKVPRLSISDIPRIIDLTEYFEEEAEEEKKLKERYHMSEDSSTPDVSVSEPKNRNKLLPDSTQTADTAASKNVASSPVLPDSISSSKVPANVAKERTDSNRKDDKKDYESLKLQGNEFVKKGNFQSAVKSYSQCIKLDPDKCVAYSNRALCYLRLNKPSLVVDDCSVVLKLESDNIKALYRRAQARKMLKQYKESLSDLTHLLKCDATNAEAKKEMNLVKQYYREELEALKIKKPESKPNASAPKTKTNPESTATTTTTTTNTKKTKHKKKRLVIEEVDEEDDVTSVPKNERSSSADVHQSSRQQQKHEKLKEKVSGKHKPSQCRGDPQQQPPSSPTTPVLPPVPPISIPNLENASPFEFMQAWNSLKKHAGTEGYASILKQVPPSSLPTLLSNKLDADMLSVIIRALADHIVSQGDNKLAAEILQNLCKASRFQTVAMFLSKKQKNEVKTVIDQLSANLGSAEVAKLKTAFSIKS